MDPLALAGFVLAALGVIGGIALAWPYFKGRANLATQELLESSLEIERRERVESERRCERQIAELNGRINALTPEFAEVIAVAVIRTLEERDDPGAAMRRI